RSAHLPPDGRDPGAGQLAEHLADLGCGREIAVRAEWVARHVVAVLRMTEAEPHILIDRDRPLERDEAPDLGLQRRHQAAWAAARGGRRRPRTISQTPNRSSGTDSSMPMVRPPHRKPSCGSG